MQDLHVDTAYTSFEDVRAGSGDVTRDIAVMVHKEAGRPQRTRSLDNLSLPLLEPEIGRASDFARPGGFRRQYIAAKSGIQLESESLIGFYSAFANTILSMADSSSELSQKGRETSKTKTMGVAHTIMALLKSFVGSAVLFLPKGYDNGGLVLSNLLLMAMAAITVFCVGRLLACSQLLERRGFRDVEYSQIAMAAMGPAGAFAVNLSLVLSQLGFCCGYVIFIASNIQGAFGIVFGPHANATAGPNHINDTLVNSSAAAMSNNTHALSGTGANLQREIELLANVSAVDSSFFNVSVVDSSFAPAYSLPPAWVLILAQVPIFIAFAWVRRLSYFAVSNLVADALIVVGLGVIFSSAAAQIATSSTAPSISLYSSRFPLFLGTAAFAFEGIGLVLPIFSSMHPHLRPQLPTLLRDTLAFVLLIFMVFASTVYAAYGKSVQIIVTDNLPASSAVPVQLAYSAALALSYPLMMYPVIAIIEGHLIPESSRVNPALKWRKNVLRASIVLVSALIAWLGFDTLDNFVALIGAFCSVPLAIIYPVLMHSRLGQVEEDTKSSPPRSEAEVPQTEAPEPGNPPKAGSLTIKLSSYEQISNVVVGCIGVAICVFCSAFAILTWPR